MILKSGFRVVRHSCAPNMRCGAYHLIVLAAAVMIETSASFAVSVYSIQLKWCNSAEAQQLKSQYSPLGSPIYVVPDPNVPDKAKIVAGNFRCYAQAWSYKQKLGNRLPADAFIYNWDSPTVLAEKNYFAGCAPFNCRDIWTGPEKYTSEATSEPTTNTLSAELESAGMKAWPAPDASLCSKPVSSMTRDELLSVGMNVDLGTSGLLALTNFVDRYATDTAVKRAKLALARRLLHVKDFERAEKVLSDVCRSGTHKELCLGNLYGAYGLNYSGKKNEALEAFSRIAGDCYATVGVRRDAAERAAVIAHSLGDLAASWLAFEQMENSAATGEAAAEARLQLAGLGFELVGRQKGTRAEVEALCSAVKEVTGATKKQRATADLMRLELRLKDSDSTATLRFADEFIERYSDIRRELFTALLYKATLLCRVRRIEEAAVIYNRILAEDFKRDDKFAAAEPLAEAASWMVSIYKMRSEDVKAQQMLNFLKTRFPERPEVREAEAVLSGTMTLQAQQ